MMIRYIFRVGFLLAGLGLPLVAQASCADSSTHSASSKAGSKSILPAPRNCSQSTNQSPKKTEIIVTSDKSRAEISQALASMPQPAHQAHPKAASDQSRAAVSTTLASKQESTLSLTQMAQTSPARDEVDSDHFAANTRLARVTAYWADEGDYYTERGLSATGVRLHDGHCAVDPNIIPYGSVVEIAGVGKYLAVDTGSAVISRTAAREGGHTYDERHAIVIDVFFEDASEGERFAARDAKFVSVSWWTPTAMDTGAREARSLFADENWTKIQSKQL